VPTPRQLDGADAMFVAGETPTHYQHVALLMQLRGAGRRRPDLERVRAQCIERLGQVPRLRWKLHEVPLGIDRPYWVDDPAFSFDHHVHRISLPRPGGALELAELVGHLYSHALDRSRPLWALWLIGGLQRNRIALLFEFHHCLMDGSGAMKLLDSLCDGAGPHAGKAPADDADAAGAPPDVAATSIRAALHLAQVPGSVTRAVYGALRPRLREQPGTGDGATAGAAAPTVSFNGELGQDRSFAFGEMPLAKLQRIKQAFGVTLNDLVLALASGAIRDMLLRHGELPGESLRATIPVSLREQGDVDYGNRVTNATVTLATHLEDPLARLHAIHADCSAAKAAAHGGSSGVIELFHALPPLLVGGVMGALPAERAPQILGSNLVVSNVRGAATPMHIAGARIEHIHPMSILTAGMGINITCASHEATLDVGITVDPRRVPDPWTLVADLEAALAEYARAAVARRRTRAPGRTRDRSRQ
jgi:WS/DGAT/MGAT family acyltransferase